MTGTLTRPRILVVGASAGVGRATAATLKGRGARVVIAGRRADKIKEAGRDIGAVDAISCDVRDADACSALVDSALIALGGLDTIIYTAGTSPLALVRDMTPAQWRAVLETNVIGFASVFAAASKHLDATRGRVLALSSYSVSSPKPGLVPYAASKAALETLIVGLRLEHPRISFCTVAIANTAPTEFTRDFDPALASQLTEQWKSGGTFAYRPMELAEVAGQLADIVAAPMVVERAVFVGPNADV